MHNPVAVKLGPTATPEEVVGLCERLNPRRVPGRLVLFSRMGADRVADALPPLLRAVKLAGHPVVWACDPMHGNTFEHESGVQDAPLRRHHAGAARVLRRLRGGGVWPGGVHVELTGEDVTECLGGADAVLDTHLDHRYETMCDPRLNARQSLDLAFETSALLRR